MFFTQHAVSLALSRQINLSSECMSELHHKFVQEHDQQNLEERIEKKKKIDKSWNLYKQIKRQTLQWCQVKRQEASTFE